MNRHSDYSWRRINPESEEFKHGLIAQYTVRTVPLITITSVFTGLVSSLFAFRQGQFIAAPSETLDVAKSTCSIFRELFAIFAIMPAGETEVVSLAPIPLCDPKIASI